MSVPQRERQFYDEEWKKVDIRKITGRIEIPGLETLDGKRLLVCSSGTGIHAVRAAKQGAETYAFDISRTAVENTLMMAAYNDVRVQAAVMDFHSLSYKDSFFDVLYGSAILHHVDCSAVGEEIFRVLKPGGIAFFRENSDRNPILRILRRQLFGEPGGYQKQRFLFIERTGTTDEYPLTDKEVETLAETFDGNIGVYNESFRFFILFNRLIFRNPRLGQLLRSLDTATGRAFPFLRKYSFEQQLLLMKPDEAA
jgi:SAM-dependent methyltransferase